MRIAHLVCTFPPYKGGMGNVAFQQAKELVKLGHSVTVFTPQRSIQLAPEPLLEDEIMEGIRVRRIKPWLKAGQGAFLPQFFWLLKEFDIIHLHYPFFGGAEVVWFARLIYSMYRKAKNFCVLLRCYPRKSTFMDSRKGKALMTTQVNVESRYQKLVLHYHMDVKEVKAGIFKYLLPLNKFVLPQILKSADKIIASSKDYVLHSQIKNYIKKHSEKFQEIPFGVDQERFYPIECHPGSLVSGKRSRDLPIKPNDKIILFVGGLDQAHYFKGVNYLLRALKLITNYSEGVRSHSNQLPITSCQLLIVGDGDLRSNYEKLAQDLGIQNQVIFVGTIPDEDLPKYYNLADIFVLPSIDQSEAFGLVLLEAMACAKPCIASNLPGVRTVIDDKKTGFLVEPRNINDLVEKMIRLLNNEELSQKFGQAGLEKVKRIYSWKKAGKQLEILYKN